MHQCTCTLDLECIGKITKQNHFDLCISLSLRSLELNDPGERGQHSNLKWQCSIAMLGQLEPRPLRHADSEWLRARKCCFPSFSGCVRLRFGRLLYLYCIKSSPSCVFGHSRFTENASQLAWLWAREHSSSLSTSLGFKQMKHCQCRTNHVNHHSSHSSPHWEGNITCWCPGICTGILELRPTVRATYSVAPEFNDVKFEVDWMTNPNLGRHSPKSSPTASVILLWEFLLNVRPVVILACKVTMLPKVGCSIDCTPRRWCPIAKNGVGWSRQTQHATSIISHHLTILSFSPFSLSRLDEQPLA